MSRILIVDDDETMGMTLSLMVKRAGHEARLCPTLAQGLQAAAAATYDVVFLDVRLPDGNGLEALTKFEQAGGEPEVIIITGFGEADSAELAITSGAWDYIEKGSSIKEISLALERALKYRQGKLQAERVRSPRRLKRDSIVGTSPAIMACLDVVAEAAESDANVLITGETGTGKELFARAVHDNSLRAGKSFTVVDCAALPDNLVESLLFGHEKGTFTGAERQREGLIREAHGGTLFLDEIGELPLGIQKNFLRVLQERRFRPLGGQREIESNFRLVAATNRNLDEMVASGGFREDLLFRLKAFVIQLPPLRERCQDIKDIVRHHIDRFCERYALPIKGVSPDFLETLTAYPWPGNVRQLVNTLEQCLIKARHEPILFPQHLPVDIRAQVARTSVAAASQDTAPGEADLSGGLPSLHDFRDRIYAGAEKQYLQELMVVSRGDMDEAGRISGLSPSRLYALMKAHDIRKPH
jgi:two-component system NtrC family response regulator